jgi:hypothetical protein
MVEKICASCEAGNALDAVRCANCGATLEEALARRPNSFLNRTSPALPARWQQAGRAVALGAVALAVEAGAAWLQHRATRPRGHPPAPLARSTAPKRHSYVARQRVWETYNGGELSRRVVEQTVWHLPDE